VTTRSVLGTATRTAYAQLDDADTWAVDRAVSLPEVWALVAAFAGLAGLWRLFWACTATRAGAAGVSWEPADVGSVRQEKGWW
jgi:hypothetical protein